MRVSQIIRSIKTQPQLWTLKYENDLLMGFEYQGYTFLKMTKKYGGEIRLVNKVEGVEMEWQGEDAVGSQLWSSVIMHYIYNNIITK